MPWCVSTPSFCNGVFQGGRLRHLVTISRIEPGPGSAYAFLMPAAARSLKSDRYPCLLVVDDDQEIRDLLSALLSRRGYRVVTARQEQEMHQILSASRVDLVILDLMLPGKDGLVICRELRASSSVPIIMLTARGDPTDRIVGLEVGADDYLPKPFDVRELEARIRAILRRTVRDGNDKEPSVATKFVFDGWTLDPRHRQLFAPEGALVELTSGEFDLLCVFVERPQKTLTRDQLLDLTRGRDAAPFDRSIDIQVSRLRRKIELDAKAPEIIKTVRSSGYLFTPKVQRT
jgi:two-component system OmpR family response regulator